MFTRIIATVQFFAFLLLPALVVSIALADPMSDTTVLNGRGNQAMSDFLYAKVKSAAARPLPASKAEFEASLPERKAQLMRCLGLDPMPPRTPLNTQITGTIQRDGYRIEKIVFYSRPGFPVTGHLYIPSTGGPKFPTILNVIGHWQHKKMEPTEQDRYIAQVKHGYVAFAIDAPGYSWDGQNLVERKWQGAHWDFPLQVGSADVTSIYVWDCMRAVDYLETRSEVDIDRLGITGVSGGGLCTTYAFAAEPRFKVGVPVCYPASMEIAPDNGCICNHIPGMLQIGDRADVMSVRAPAPLFVIGAENDEEFPKEGTLLTGKKLKAIWDLYGAGNDTKAEIFPGGHDYSQLMRESSLGWFDKYLKNAPTDAPVPEPAITTEDPNNPEFLCLPKLPPDMRTLRDIGKDNLKTATAKTFAEVAKLNGGLPKRGPLDLKTVGQADGKTYLTFASEPGLTIPAILWLPKQTPRAGVVLVSEDGKATAYQQFQVDELLKNGYAVMAIDVRGVGELTGMDIRLMMYLGTAGAFAQATDACAACEAMRHYATKISIVGSGTAGAQVAMFTALMDPSVNACVGLQGMHNYADCFQIAENQYVLLGFSLQPRARYSAPLESLRSMVACPSQWTFSGDPNPPLVGILNRQLGQP